jgi:hypothetical protein
MKTIKWTPSMKNIGLSILAMSLVFTLGSCSTNAAFLSSKVVPAAKGKVKVKKDSNSNYSIKVKISNLAESAQLTPPKKAYVVWLVDENQSVHNIGQIDSSTGFLSSKLKAGFETVSTFRPVRLFITAENDKNTNTPSDEEVLTTAAL